MGSASTGQVLAEALGLALPGSALTPAPLAKLLRYARATGKQILRLIEEDIIPQRILTREAFENAITLHAAVGGSTNALIHLPAIAREAEVEITIDDFGGMGDEEALNFAVAASALKHTIPGDLNLVTLAEVQHLVSGDATARAEVRGWPHRRYCQVTGRREMSFVLLLKGDGRNVQANSRSSGRVGAR